VCQLPRVPKNATSLNHRYLNVFTNSCGEPEKLANDLGLHVYIDAAVDDAPAVLQRMGGARAILATAPSGDGMGPLVSALAVRGSSSS
jgi:hypothetical protein